ncbi:uncharacterized protein EDB91DRAFT_1336135 [Suillus paluster]|uniref:uncharacterized protein n=1 Tax=Suillus paluster TaxID=48578 RepID=UPI001B8672C3|nr:uncharacterized protein EDB91DRAFT_1336135 [Suillus paluster]KAG1742356.1 hypothetical protein EDB91DRAFT_1336135 [Suillus paluster]
MSDAGESQVSRKPKVLIATFDGTAGSYDATNSNVVKFVSLLKKDTDSQLSYYQVCACAVPQRIHYPIADHPRCSNKGTEVPLIIQAGVGTYFSPGVVSPMFTWLAKILDEAFAWYLDVHVMEGYKFLMDNYRPGDKICLFGFSRGAYTARAVSGNAVQGQLLVGRHWKLPFVLRHRRRLGYFQNPTSSKLALPIQAYKQTGTQADLLAAGFKQTFSHDVRVEFVGVWDTVQSTGMLLSRSLPFTNCNTLIKTFRHALALDEHRVKFQPNLYHRPQSDTADPEFAQMSKLSEAVAELEDRASGKNGSLRNKLLQAVKRGKKLVKRPKFQGLKHGFKKIQRQQSTNEIVAEMPGETIIVKEETSVEVLDSPDVEPIPPSDVLEVWFPGCHTDIGGGNVGNSVKVSLAQTTLRWMVEQVLLSQCGIVFDEAALERVGMPLSSLPISKTPPATENPTGKSPPMTDTTVLSAATNDTLVEEEPLPAPSSPPTDPPTTPSQPNPETCDALAPLFDELQLQKAWWLLEIIPLPFAWQDAHGKWHKKWKFHMGKGRAIPYQHPKFHSSVKERMDYIPLNYKPRARYRHEQVIFV